MKTLSKNRQRVFYALLLSLCLIASVTHGQSGGGYDLSHNVIAGGGGLSSNGALSAEGTVGPAIAGKLSSSGSFSIKSGFWAFQFTVPTSANVMIRGQVFTTEGSGLGHVNLILFDTFTMVTRSTTTDRKGNYSFDELEVGHFYILKAERKRYLFTPESYAFELFADRTDVNFTGIKQKKIGDLLKEDSL